MLSQWKKILFVFIVAGVLYGGCNTQVMLKTEAFFREENPNLALTPKMCYFIGNIAYLTFRYKLAIEVIDRNLKDFPYADGAVKAEFRRAVCYEKLGDYAKAIHLYEDYLLAHPKDHKYQSIQNKIAKLRALYAEE